MGMVHAYNQGELKDPPQIVIDIAKSMKKKDVLDLAETKHKGLPEKKKEKKSSLISQLMKIADSLDEKEMFDEADIVDGIMSRISNDL